jgi:hypothetical protein
MLPIAAGLVTIAGVSLTGLVLVTQRQRKLHRWQEAG